MSKLQQTIDKGECYIIAEIGQNHQGKVEIAKQMADAAAKCGAHAIKTVKRDLKTFKERNEALWNQPYDHPNSFGKTYGEHRTALELSGSDIIELKDYIETTTGLDFICSFTDIPSAQFLYEIGLEIFKVPSQRLTDISLMENVALMGVPTIISTGMSSMADIRFTMNLFKQYNGTHADIYLLQCTSCYPCKELDLHLRVIESLKKEFGVPVGFSGHHIGIAPDIAARALGAEIIERHFTLCRAWKGTDHAASLEPAGLEKVCRYIKQCDESMGTHIKEVLECEKPAMIKLRADLL